MSTQVDTKWLCDSRGILGGPTKKKTGYAIRSVRFTSIHTPCEVEAEEANFCWSVSGIK